MEMYLKILSFERLPGAGQALAIYNVNLEGEQSDGSVPAIRGVRVFQAADGRHYIRLPQAPKKNRQGFMNIVTLPKPYFERLQAMILDHFQRTGKVAPPSEIDLSRINF